MYRRDVLGACTLAIAGTAGCTDLTGSDDPGNSSDPERTNDSDDNSEPGRTEDTVTETDTAGNEPIESSAPSVTVEIESNSGDDTVTITHQGGDSLSPDRVRIESADGSIDTSLDQHVEDEFSISDSFTLDVPADSSGVIRLVWVSDDGDAYTLAERSYDVE